MTVDKNFNLPLIETVFLGLRSLFKGQMPKTVKPGKKNIEASLSGIIFSNNKELYKIHYSPIGPPLGFRELFLVRKSVEISSFLVAKKEDSRLRATVK